MGSKNYLVYDVDLMQELNANAVKHKPAGATKPLFALDESLPFQPSYSIDSKQFKRIEDDKLLRKLVQDKSQPAYDQMLANLELAVKRCAAGCNGAATKAELDALWTTIIDTLSDGGDKILKDAHDTMTTYLSERTLGKVAKQKYQVKKAKGILKVTAGVASIGGAIASAIASFGGTSPAVVVAFYGTYKAVRETQDAFKKAARSHEKYKISIENTIQELQKKYAGATPEEIAELTTAGEVKSKVGKELLGFTGQSIKKLEESIAGYDKAVEIAFYAQSRLGKEVGQLEKDGEKVEEYLEELAKKLQGADEKARDKILRKVAKGQECIQVIDKESKQILSAAAATHAALTQAKTESDDWKQTAKDMKTNRADWVRHVSKPLKFVSIGAAVASQDYGEAAEQGATALVEIAAGIGNEVVALIDDNKKKAKSK